MGKRTVALPHITQEEAEVLSTQQAVVLDYLRQARAITNVVAIAALGVGSLSSRIAELRRAGFAIVDKIDVGRDGRSFKKYRLREHADDTYA